MQSMSRHRALRSALQFFSSTFSPSTRGKSRRVRSEEGKEKVALCDVKQLRGAYKRAEVCRAELQREKKNPTKLLLFSFKHFFCPLNGGSLGEGKEYF